MTDAILIYGGSGGIGSALARALAERGTPVHLVGRDEARLKAVADEIGAGVTVGDVEGDAMCSPGRRTRQRRVGRSAGWLMRSAPST